MTKKRKRAHFTTWKRCREGITKANVEKGRAYFESVEKTLHNKMLIHLYMDIMAKLSAHSEPVVLVAKLEKDMEKMGAPALHDRSVASFGNFLVIFSSISHVLSRFGQGAEILFGSVMTSYIAALSTTQKEGVGTKTTSSEFFTGPSILHGAVWIILPTVQCTYSLKSVP